MTVHLHIRTSYSLLESTIRIPTLVHLAKEKGYSSLVISDHNVLFGVPSFLKECKKEGIKGIVGLEVDCLYHDEKVPFLFIAKNARGYVSLMQLSSYMQTHHAPCSLEQLQQAQEHCFVIVYGEGGYLQEAMRLDDRQNIMERLDILKQDFRSFDIALSYQQSSLYKKANTILKQICLSKGIHCVALNKIYYLNKEDSKYHKALRCIKSQDKFYEQTGGIVELTDRYLLSPQEMDSLYDLEELKRTEEIAKECICDYDTIHTELSHYDIPNTTDAKTYLTKLCIAGLKKRFHDRPTDIYVDRLKKELKVILDMHFENYFLIVFDYIRYAKMNHILVGPGRGSAAGSLVAYCLGITEVDPLKYDLLFERFLTKERVSLPDIDTDFPDDKRADVIDYVVKKYGKDHVANIIAFSTLSAKAVTRDVAKILNMSEHSLNLYLKHIPVGKVSLKNLYANSTSFRKLVESEKQYTTLYHISVALEGLPRNLTQHAAGIVISEKPLQEVVPVLSMKEDMYTVQYEASYLEERGLIKMDFLSLKNLSMIANIVDLIHKEDEEFVLPTNAFEDPEIYSIFSRGDTNGIFQFESEESKRILRKLRPNSFRDIVAANAINRPGAIDSIDAYMKGRDDPSSISYLSSDLEPFLKDTYGVLLYQEQIMLIAQHSASFSAGKADSLRKAIAKKDPIKLEALKKDFMLGCLKHGYSQEVTETLWASIEKFGFYGFNKAHSVAYSMISCQMAYLKKKYPLYFYSVLLNNVIGDVHKTTSYLDECRRKGIQIYPISVNASKEIYYVKEGGIVLPFSIIKGIGTSLALEIVKEREENGEFEDYADFVARMNLHKVKEASFINLIHAGTFDCFGETRKTLLENLKDVLDYADLVKVKVGDTYTINTSLLTLKAMQKYQEISSEKMKNEKEVLGFCMNNQEFLDLRKEWNIQDPPLAAIQESYGKEVQSFARILSIQEKTSKNQNKYCRLFITDGLTDCNISLWPSEYNRVKNQLQEGTYIKFHGKMSDNGYIQVDKVQILKKEA